MSENKVFPGFSLFSCPLLENNLENKKASYFKCSDNSVTKRTFVFLFVLLLLSCDQKDSGMMETDFNAERNVFCNQRQMFPALSVCSGSLCFRPDYEMSFMR